MRRQATDGGQAAGPLGSYSSRPVLFSSSYPLGITGAITAFIKSVLLQCLSIQLTFRLAIMWHVERVWWLEATISCFWKGLLCILTSMNKGGHSRNGYCLFALACGEQKLRLWSLHAIRAWPGSLLILPGFNCISLATGYAGGGKFC